MNYIEQLNSFFDLLYTKPLSTSAICLYVILFHLNNKCGWLKEFTVANMTIQGLSGMSRNQLHKARLELIQNGYVNYKKGNGNQCGKYLLVRFDTQKNTQTDTQLGTQTGTQTDTQKQYNVGTLNKLNKTKQNETKVKKESVKKKFGEYQNVLLTEKEYQSLNSDFPNIPELIKFLDEYIEMKGYKAKSHYLAIRKWVKDAVDERKPKQQMQYINPFQMTEEQKMADRERQKKMLQEAIDRGDFDVKHGRHV